MIYYRRNKTYEGYVLRQGKKALNDPKYVLAGEEKRKRKFIERFKLYLGDMIPGKVLCLGARTGTEVMVARKLGFANSIGIDLYPLGDCVLKGDWHNMPFDDNTYENVYTNSLDHCYDFSKLAREIYRVLVPGGRFVYESHTKYALDYRTKENKIDIEKIVSGESQKHPLNTMFWDSIKDIAIECCQQGNFKIVNGYIQRQWSGYVLEKVDDGK